MVRNNPPALTLEVVAEIEEARAFIRKVFGAVIVNQGTRGAFDPARVQIA